MSRLRRPMTAALAVLTLAVAACGTGGPYGTNDLDLSEPGTITFQGTEVEVTFDEGFEETVELEGEPPVQRKSFYVEDRLAFTAYDTDGDGSDDLWLQYDEDLYLAAELRDDDGDGEADVLIRYDRDENVISQEDL